MIHQRPQVLYVSGVFADEPFLQVIDRFGYRQVGPYRVGLADTRDTFVSLSLDKRIFRCPAFPIRQQISVIFIIFSRSQTT